MIKGNVDLRKNVKIHFKLNEYNKLKQSSTNSVLEMKINVVLEIDINRSSSDRIENAFKPIQESLERKQIKKTFTW